MRALSVKQPWANTFASGQKTIETRTWMTTYRGPLLILSSKQPKIEPVGCALALCELVDCRLMTDEDERDACCAVYYKAHSWVLSNTHRVKPFSVTGGLDVFECGIGLADLTFV